MSATLPGVTGMLTSEEAARRLGIKVATLYAYVSRGLIAAHRSPERRSLFAVEDVEALARRGRPAGPSDGLLAATVTTSITDIGPEGPIYRGVPAVDLAPSASFEAVADLLWQVPPGPWAPAEVGPAPVQTAGDRLRWAVVMSGATDALRADLRDVAVARAARTIVATMVVTIGGGVGETAAPVADRLATALGGTLPGLPDAVRAALVLLADHELASSTVTVRTAASTRADVYDAVLAGLGTASGPLHGGASRLAHLLLEDAARRGAAAALDDALRWQRTAPGFGHFLYGADPRFGALWPFVARLSPSRLEVAASVAALAAERGLPAPNIDFGLAALTFVSEMDPDAGGVLFMVARVAGWVAHYLEELTERPLRYRVRAVHVTPRRPSVHPLPGARPGSGPELP
jgi:citrate synthase